ncbi:MAG: hypothetical protein R3F31_14770 [Verrucomicrobiales bacterium]
MGLDDFQVTTPFPGGPANDSAIEFQLDPAALATFLGELFDICRPGTREAGSPSDLRTPHRPFHRTSEHAQFPASGKKSNNQFISVDSKGTVAQCDRWVTSYPDYYWEHFESRI